MLWQFIPWKFFIRRAARAYGMIDPVSFLARVRSFSQPSEVKEPMELVRANMLFQARGLINARAIQFNLDWVWPYWVERQFNPEDASFVPRGYAPTHVNLTQRNWTAAGLPGAPVYPLVDPRGLVTPLNDGWSLDFWIMGADREPLLPSKLATAVQNLDFSGGLAVKTEIGHGAERLGSRVRTEIQDDEPVLHVDVDAECGEGRMLVVSIRPYNPEGVRFVEKIRTDKEGHGFTIDGEGRVVFDREPLGFAFSNYERGDVLNQSPGANETSVKCSIGMATSAAWFAPDDQGRVSLGITVPLGGDLRKHFNIKRAEPTVWGEVLKETAEIRVPNDRLCFLFEAAKRTLVMLSAYRMFPGPFTYRRFWFRDAVFMGHALMGLNMPERAMTHLSRFPKQQKHDGYFESQEGEWDSNGQVLWLADKLHRALGKKPSDELAKSLFKGTEWIIKKRLHKTGNPLIEGLLPAGFSAEHLGPNDYYYWDDFWGVAGLRAASRLARSMDETDRAERWAREAVGFERAIFSSIASIPEERARGAIPASPNRRMDAGAIGSMVADYPLQVTGPGHERIMNTVAFLRRESFHNGGFFQDMVHSGINVYLTLDLAQTLLRAGDSSFRDIMGAMMRLASPTGNWPEAVHPFSGGGCMGDGQHGWAAAEWIMLVKNMFVREEGEMIVLGSGVDAGWLEHGEVSFGPTASPFGRVSFELNAQGGKVAATLHANWSGEPPTTLVAIPGFTQVPIRAGETVELNLA